MIKSIVLSALCAVFASSQFLAEVTPKQILQKLKELHLGGDHENVMPSDRRVQTLTEELRSLFAALPKNPRGALRPSSARYALHRLFVQRHGWHFNGLAPRGDTWESSSPTSALGKRVPEDVSELFQRQLTENGLDLHDLATLAAVMENMVHSEADVRLAASFDAMNLPLDSSLTLNQSTRVLETYMASFVMGSDAQQLSKNTMLQKMEDVHEQYPTWPNTQQFLQTVRKEVTNKETNLTFTELSAVVAEAGERYGRWQSHECSELKHSLLQHEEHPNTGRVRLSDFYGMALHGGHWQFSESLNYLRHLGALDDSDPEVMKVIVANYILGPSNCIASSGYVAVCCIDECESKMRSLEDKLKAPQAPAEAILGALNASVSLALKEKLKDVAKHHGGEVPLHGRLFAQWMHHFAPQECPYPHMSGTINPLHPEIFEEQGESVAASQEEMMQQVEGSGWKKAPDFEEGLCSKMWTMEEELVDPSRSTTPSAPSASAWLRGVALATAVSSLMVTMMKIVSSLRPSTLKSAPRVYCV